MKLNFKIFSIFALTLLLTSFLVVPTSQAASSNEPNVFIAVDGTANANCVLKHHISDSTSSTTTTTSVCSPGTVIVSKQVRLSQAIAAGEKYVIVPPQPWTPTVIAKFNKEVDTLMHEKDAAIKARTVNSNIVHPNTNSCGSTDTLEATWNAFGANLDSTLGYSLPYSCAYVDLIYFTQQSNSANGFDHMQYSSAYWDPGCPDLSKYTYGYLYKLDAIENIGLYFEPYVASGTLCGISDKAYINLGPVN